MLGYVSFYFKLEIDMGESLGSADFYAKYTSDFSKGITEEVGEIIKRTICKAYSSMGKVMSIDYCTEEEYESNTSNMHDTTIKWDENDVWVERN